ncbi:MAG: hypothetical protein JJE50_03635 [Actinomycetales bacterium]|nr:hypothetical protein [Actinomycetales bacterium]
MAATRLPVAPPSGRVLRHPQVRPGHVLLELCQPSGAAERVTVSKKAGPALQVRAPHQGGQTWPRVG